ncbi:zf-DHHC-domain-containing protein [Microthyrium microscopicum]|uniref:Palmitoyltransferase n=1 Tax=Microthyrium microscopicum TaxID=703497 RepID=A0A6A6UKX0_9PEZI|nr:zf-DHHC-domain-containing protein [Microthyrium microscopicum]
MPASRGAIRMNTWSGRIIPLIAIAANAYVLYVITKSIAVDYLLQPTLNYIPKRRAIATVFIALQYILAIPTFSSWLRYAIAILTNPGYTPQNQKPRRRGSSRTRSSSQRRSRSASRTRDEKRKSDGNMNIDRHAVREGTDPTPPGLEHFYRKQVFTCSTDGVPSFCERCWAWKQDRVHHCKELNRCVSRFDHYCPWVGGIVGETSHKFFIQFAFYASLYSGFIFASCLWAVVQSKKDCHSSPVCNRGWLNPHWIVAIALAGIFGFMAFGITLKFGHSVLKNRTTIEELAMGHPNYCVAIRINPSEIPPVSSDGKPKFWVVPYPFRPQTSGPTDQHSRRNEFLYAILYPKPGSHIWDLGWNRNWRDLMGNHVIDWFLPIKLSPCLDHGNLLSDYPLGKDFEELEKTYLPHRYKNGIRRIPLDEGWVEMTA